MLYKNLNGTTSEEFSLGKGVKKVHLRTNNGVIERKNYGGTWIPLGFGITSVFGSERVDYESLDIQSTTSDEYQQADRLTTGNLVVGARYRLGWYYEISSSSTSRSVIARVELDDTTEEQETSYEPKDRSNWYSVSGFAYYTANNTDTHFADIDFKSSVLGTEVGIRKVRMEFWRVS